MSYLAESFVWCMLQVTVFTTVVTLAYVAVRRAGATANAVMLVGCLAIVGMLTLLSASPWPSWSMAGATPAQVQVEQTYVSDQVQFTQLIEDPTAETPQHLEDLPHVTGVAQPELSGSSAKPASLARWPVLAGAAWILAAVGAARTAVAWSHLRRILRLSRPVSDRKKLLLCRELCGQLDICGDVELRETAGLSGAATVGWRRPVVLLPASESNWTPEQMRAVLAHELAHVRRHHFPAWLISQAAVVAHYYHPLVHWLARRLRLEQEIEADQIAASLYGDRRQYAAVLAGLALAPKPSPLRSTGVGLFMSRPILMRRIAMLRQPSESARNSSRIVRGVVFAIVAITAIGAAGLRMQPTALGDDEIETPVIAASDDALETALPASTAPSDSKPVIVDLPEQTDATKAVTALLRVSRRPAGVMSSGGDVISDNAWKVYCRTQVALIKSYFVLQAALKSPEIASLPIVKSQRSPIAWLQKSLQVGFYPDTEILFVTLPTTNADAEQSRSLVDAVVSSYLEEVVTAERHRRSEAREMLARTLQKLENELKEKMDEFYAIAKELEAADDSGSGQLMQQLDLRRLDRVETELMRLEDDMLKAEVNGDREKQVTYLQRRIETLHERQEELEEKLRVRSEKSVDLSMRRAELNRLQDLAKDLSLRLEMADINLSANGQDTVQVLQKATLVGDASSANARQ
jgi:beta-lactamase regulating signal transducer with metallopeptidase domain